MCALMHAQAALRWRQLSTAIIRQSAVVDRAVRMYGLRVVLATQRAAFQEWARLAATSRLVKHATAQAFVTAGLALYTRELRSKAFHGWQRWA